MADWEDKTGNGEGGPAVEWRLVTPSNTAYISRPRGLYVDVTGTLSVEDSLGNITTGVASYTVSGATDQIEFPYAGDDAVMIRATLTGTAGPWVTPSGSSMMLPSSPFSPTGEILIKYQ